MMPTLHIFRLSASSTAGTGALRNAVQAHLKRLKYVKSFHLGEYGEGDAGVTIAEFKD